MNSQRSETSLQWQEAVQAGPNSTCGISNHEVYCWGKQLRASLETAREEERLTPVKVQFP